MAKVIKQADKFKPITCVVCGCVYEFEKGDRIEALRLERGFDATLRVIELMLECPICGIANKLEKDNEQQYNGS
jgi:rubredoxin